MMYNRLKCWLVFIVLLPVCIIKGYSQEKEITKDLYIASTIPDSLKEIANSVVRYSLEDDMVKGPGRMISKVHRIVTVLNEKGDDEAIMQLFYNKKYDSYSDIEMRVYDEKGSLIKKYISVLGSKYIWFKINIIFI